MLESKLVRSLDEAGFFVEPNQSILDERTGKSREIDLVAEYYDPSRLGNNVCVKTHFVIEAINNTLPFVLLTPRPKSPVMASYEDYLKYATTPKADLGDHPFLGEIDFYELKGVNKWQVFSQWCTLTRKKSGDELMPSHSDDVYSSILKMAEYTLDTIEQWSLRGGGDYWRLFLWQPVLVIRDDLMVLTGDIGGRPDLKNVQAAKFEFNFHYKLLPRTVIIQFVTEANLIPYLMDVTKSDKSCHEQLSELRATVLKERKTVRGGK